MTDEKLVQNSAAEEPQDQKTDGCHTLKGKIARLPADIREEINTRLYDGKSGPDILAWLNELPVVKEILAAKFSGVPVNEPNLSNWRATGYRRWQWEQDRLARMKERGLYATNMADAAGGSIARGTAATASEKILELLDEDPGEKVAPADLIKAGHVAARLLHAEQNAIRLKISHERLRQHELQLLLMRDRIQRDDTAIGLRVLGKAQAEKIAAAPVNNAVKIELLGRDMFGLLWEPRPMTAGPPGPPAS
jgi:hypothetical protein